MNVNENDYESEAALVKRILTTFTWSTRVHFLL